MLLSRLKLRKIDKNHPDICGEDITIGCSQKVTMVRTRYFAVLAARARASRVIKIFITACTVGFLALVVGGNWYLWRHKISFVYHIDINDGDTMFFIHTQEHPNVPVTERCSSEYPNYSKILDHYVNLPDKNLQVEDGTVYPLDAVWESDGIIKGCPCSIRSCVHSCCQEDQVMEFEDNENLKCAETNGTSYGFSQNEPIYLFPNQHQVLYANCEKASKTEYTNIWEILDGKLKYNTAQCVDIRKDNGRITCSSTVYTCSKSLVSPSITRKTLRLRLALKYSCILLSMGLHLVTLVVFTLVPHLRTGYGPTLMVYQAAQLLRKSTVVLRYFTEISQPSHAILAEVEYFSQVLFHVCQIVIAYQVWTGFKKGRINSRDTSGSYKLIGCCVVFSALLTILFFRQAAAAVQWMEWYENRVVLLQRLKPYPFIEQLKQTIPVLVAEMISMVLCVTALYRIRTGLKECKSLEGCDSKRLNAPEVRWSSLLLKLSLVTGVDCTLVTILSISQMMLLIHYSIFIPYYVIYILRDINYLRGSEVFFIFVLKSNVGQSLLKTYRSIRHQS